MIITQLDLLKKHTSRQQIFDAAMEAKFGNRYSEYRRKHKELYSHSHREEFPLYVMIEQTYQCNLRCPSCIHAYKSDKERFDTGTSLMSLDIFKKIIDEASAHQCPSISLMVNDEPLLVKDLDRRVAYAAEKGIMDIIMTTNGYLLNPEKIDRLIRAGVTRILFSIDAATEETYKKTRPGKGDFNRVLENIKAVRDYKLQHDLTIPFTRASCVVSGLNEHETELFLRTFGDLVDSVEFQPFGKYYDRNVDLIPRSGERSFVSDFSCSEPWQKLIVRPNGDVLPCCSFYGYELVLGNMTTDSLYNIYNNEMANRIKDDVKNKDYSFDACRNCSKSYYKTFR